MMTNRVLPLPLGEGRGEGCKLSPLTLTLSQRERGFALAALLLLTGCPPPMPCEETDEGCEDAGAPPPDECNSRDEALSLSQCRLNLGEARSAYISFSGDQDWYLAQMPALDARSLVHLTGAYGASSTAVNLALNLLREDGQTSLAREVDDSTGAPKPVDIILPFTESNAKLLVLVADEGASLQPNFDARNQYTVQIEVMDNPDTNEPNDTTPTDITLSPQGAVLQGQSTGYLATDNDLDLFRFVAPAGRKIIYLHIHGPALTPPPPFRLSYRLLDPTGTPVSEGNMANAFLPVDLATARLSTAGAYTLEVQGFRSQNTSDLVPGDLRLQYTVDVQILDDLDANEPNDSMATARVVSMGTPGGPAQTLTGRLAYVPDPDWYAIDLPASAQPTVLMYRLTPGAGTGRFPALPGLVDRQVRLVQQVTQGATAQDRQNACKNDSLACPKGYEGSALFQGLVEGLCASADPAPCLLSERNEHPRFGNLRNMVGYVPVPAHTGTLRLFLAVQDDGTDWADDLDYTLSVQWQADPDDAMRAGLPNQTESQTLPASGFPDPPVSGQFSGVLSHGYGRVIENDVNQGEGVRGPNDYDAVPTDFDRFEYVFPAIPAPEDRTWTLAWDILHLPDAGQPADLALEMEFCDGAGCAQTQRNIVLAYSGDRIQPWYSGSFSDRTVHYTRQVGNGVTTITATPEGCFCFEPRFVQGGRFWFKVGAVDRQRAEPFQYRVRMGYANYPQAYTVDGGSSSCPAGPTDGGTGAACRFGQVN
ncbi:MAG: cell-cell cohesion protein MtsF [Myxococcota bacterium]